MGKICINGHVFNLEKCDRCGGSEPISEPITKSVSEPIQIKSRRKRKSIKIKKPISKKILKNKKTKKK